ncbi:hypothetical protein [Velocimicrobium porci]|uniref:Uncharacterized protein n=1 Tax=Velocimicrobium porci TaxID=2606634 RepID=A0A6L5XY40_9FIRM|nr:hypothetical protein [Velocimicrobium porci]MSS63574.1 hypothetical protein [Velocimicrobium porci]
MKKQEIYYCPICGYELPDYFGSGELCPCCFREAGYDDEIYYSELETKDLLNQNIYKKLDISEVIKVIPDYERKKNLEEDVPEKMIWAYLRAVWIKGGSFYIRDEIHKNEKNYKKCEPDWTKEKAYRQLKRIGVDAREFIKSIWGKESELYKEAVEILK